MLRQTSRCDGIFNKIENKILGIGISFFLIFIFLPNFSSSQLNDINLQDCAKVARRKISCKLSQGIWTNLLIIQEASQTLKGQGNPSDIAQDIVGFRALVNSEDPYPILGTAYLKMGLDWNINHASTHTPMAFLLVSPIAFLPWNWASAIWAWLMLALITFTLRCYGLTWKVALGLTPIVILWPPIATSLGQLTIIWLFTVVAGYRLEKEHQLWSGLLVGIATMTKLFPAILAINFLLKKKWLAILVFLSTLVFSIITIFLLHPDSFQKYVTMNKTNSIAMILRYDNSSLLVNGYRWGGWLGEITIVLFFLSIIWLNKKSFSNSLHSSSSRAWLLTSYFSTALLPVLWVFSITPLLPIIAMLFAQKKLSTVTVGFCCILIPCILPSFGTPYPTAAVVLLAGTGLLFDKLPFKLFSATSLKELREKI